MSICRILIVEDQGEVAELLASFLEEEGYDIRTVGSGPAMNEALAAERFDAVVLDMTLPGGESGWSLAERVRQEGIGLILVTGDHRHIPALQERGVPHLTKPFRLDAFKQAVEKALTQIQAECAPDRSDAAD